MHAPMTEVDGLWAVEIYSNGSLLTARPFQTREEASQWISKTLQSLPAKTRESITGYTITFTVVGRATTPVPGLPGSYQAVQEVPVGKIVDGKAFVNGKWMEIVPSLAAVTLIDPDANCCEGWKHAKDYCTDKEAYGAAVFECGGEWRIGSEDIPALRFCPWCGAAKHGGAS